MKNVKRIVFLVFFLALLLDVGYGIIACFRYENYRKNYSEDLESLRSITAEAYININEDSNFVNTATDNQPMEIPEKYYTCVESKLGFGRIHAVVYVDGSVEAYFGTPEKTVDYYLYGGGKPDWPKLPPASDVLFNTWGIPLWTVIFGWCILATTVRPVVSRLIPLLRKKDYESEITE